METQVLKEIPFSDEQLLSMVTKAVNAVFTVMLASEANYKENIPYKGAVGMPVSECLNTSDEVVASSVGFAGKINGTIFIYLTEGLALNLACKMLGLTSDEVEEEGPGIIKDTLGEIMNMTVGGFKNRLCDAGYNCELTIPSIVRGSNFVIDSPVQEGLIRKYYRYETDGQSFVMDLQMKSTV